MHRQTHSTCGGAKKTDVSQSPIKSEGQYNQSSWLERQSCDSISSRPHCTASHELSLRGSCGNGWMDDGCGYGMMDEMRFDSWVCYASKGSFKKSTIISCTSLNADPQRFGTTYSVKRIPWHLKEGKRQGTHQFWSVAEGTYACI